MRTFLLAALLAAFFMPMRGAAFEIDPPTSMAKMAMPCWTKAQLSKAMTLGAFKPELRGLLIAKTSASQPLVVVWMDRKRGRGVVSFSHPDGDECLVAIIENAE